MRPILLNLFHYPIYSYPLFLGLSFGFAYYYCLGVLGTKRLLLNSFRKLFIGVFASAWIGAKLFFILHSSADLGSSYDVSSFWLGGGFVFYGGLIFASTFALIYCKFFKKFDFKDLLICLPALPLGHAVGRLGCYLAGCCFGSESSFFWMNRHPVQLYEAIGNLFIFISLRKLQKTHLSLTPYFYFFTYTFLRFSLEFFRADYIRGIYWGLSSAQWTSIILVIIVSGIMILKKRWTS